MFSFLQRLEESRRNRIRRLPREQCELLIRALKIHQSIYSWILAVSVVLFLPLSAICYWACMQPERVAYRIALWTAAVEIILWACCLLLVQRITKRKVASVLRHDPALLQTFDHIIRVK